MSTARGEKIATLNYTEIIKGVNTETCYKNRNEAMYFSRCVEKVTGEFAKIPEVGVPICGICIKVCPSGRKMHVKKTDERKI